MISFKEATTMPACQISTNVDRALRRVAIEYAYKLTASATPTTTAYMAISISEEYLDGSAPQTDLAVAHALTIDAATDLGNERLQITGSHDGTNYLHVVAAAYTCAVTGREAVQPIVHAIIDFADEDLAAWAAESFKHFLEKACAKSHN